MENDQLKYFASLTPKELFRNLNQLNMAAYGISDESKLSKPHQVDFILIGGYAVNYYGYNRATDDMDMDST